MSALSVIVGVDYIDTREERAILETNLQKQKTGGSIIIDISNLAGYDSDGKSNTNNKGSSISSDYTGDDVLEEGVEAQ